MNRCITALSFIAVIGTSSVCFAETTAKYYDSEILTKIASTAFYPDVALSRGAEGIVAVAVTIGDNGAVTDAVVEKSSGVTALDTAALAAVRAAAPFAWPQSGSAVVHTKLKYVLEN